MTVTVVPLHEHDLLRDVNTLLHSAEADDRAGSGVRLLVSVRDTHATADRDVEASELAVLINDSNETKIVGKDIDVVVRRDGDGDLELCECQRVVDAQIDSMTNLAGEVELSVERLDVLQRITSD